MRRKRYEKDTQCEKWHSPADFAILAREQLRLVERP